MAKLMKTSVIEAGFLRLHLNNTQGSLDECLLVNTGHNKNQG